MDVDATLVRLGRYPDAEVDVFECGLMLARDEYPLLPVTEYQLRVRAYAEKLEPRLRRRPLKTQVEILAEYVFDELGFRGNDEDYYNPRNSYLNDVLDRKLGIPLTLSLVAGAVGRLAGVDIAGVALPGHFVAMAMRDGEAVVFDPFHKGRVLDEGGCEALVNAIAGKKAGFDPRLIVPATGHQILTRLLNNLKIIYLQAADFARAATVMARIVQLNPTEWLEHRDLGVTLFHAGQPGRATHHLDLYLKETPHATDADTVREFLRLARKDVARWN
jgi:regulator of sirC expression with transglutaminase-like and TPR domain